MIGGIVEEVKTALGGIATTRLDGEIDSCISAAALDMREAGIAIGVTDTEALDPLLKQAVKLYARAYFNYQGMSERWERAYKATRNTMALSGNYNREVPPNED